MCLHAVCVDQSRQNIYRLTTVEERKNPRSNQTCFCCQQQISCVQRKLFNAKKHRICSTSQSFLLHVACPVRWAGCLFLFLFVPPDQTGSAGNHTANITHDCALLFPMVTGLCAPNSSPRIKRQCQALL